MSNNNCTCCRRDWAGRSAPMLQDASWSELAGKREYLCFDCLFERARRLDIKLTLADLLPCPFNIDFWPYWFEHFAKDENQPPENISEWQREANSPASKALSKRPLHPWLAVQP